MTGSVVVHQNGATPPSPLLLSDSVFVSNGRGYSPGRAYGGYAGAVRIFGAQARVEGCAFQNSRVVNDYGAVRVQDSELSFARNLVTDNLGKRTAALSLYKVSPFTLTNNIVADNRSTDSTYSGPAMELRRSRGGLRHNTVARNAVREGILVDYHATVALTNTLIVSHSVGISVTADSTATLAGTLWGSGTWANGTDWGGDGVLTSTVDVWGAPEFVDAEGGDYHIGSGSAAVDAGVDSGVVTDIDGDLRPHEGGYDIGADEHAWGKTYLPLVVRGSP